MGRTASTSWPVFPCIPQLCPAPSPMAHGPTKPAPSMPKAPPQAMRSGALRDRVSSCSWGRGGERQGGAGGGNPAAMEFTSLLWCLIFVICKAIS